MEAQAKVAEEAGRRGKSVVDESQKHLAQIKALGEKVEKQQSRNIELAKQLQAMTAAKAAVEKQAEQARLDACKTSTELGSRQKKISSLTEELAKLRLQKAQPEPRAEPRSEKRAEENPQLVKNLLALVDNLQKQKAQLQSAVL